MYRVNVGILALCLSTICLTSNYAKVEALAVNKRTDIIMSDQSTGIFFKRDESGAEEVPVEPPVDAPATVEPPVVAPLDDNKSQQHKEQKKHGDHKGHEERGDHKGRESHGDHNGHNGHRGDKAQKRSEDNTMANQSTGIFFKRDESGAEEVPVEPPVDAPATVEPPVVAPLDDNKSQQHKEQKKHGDHKGHEERGDHKGRESHGDHNGHNGHRGDKAQKRSEDNTMANQSTGIFFKRDESGAEEVPVEPPVDAPATVEPPVVAPATVEPP
ncbi:hypothetical protein BB561_006998, partial [Smittium simulii]